MTHEEKVNPDEEYEKFEYVEETNEGERTFSLKVDEEGKVECPNCNYMQSRIKSHLTSSSHKVKCQRKMEVNDVQMFLGNLEKYKVKLKKEKYRKVHKEEIKQSKKTYKEGHKEEIKQSNKTYKEDHKEEIKQSNKTYKEGHKEEI